MEAAGAFPPGGASARPEKAAGSGRPEPVVARAAADARSPAAAGVAPAAARPGRGCGGGMPAAANKDAIIAPAWRSRGRELGGGGGGGGGGGDWAGPRRRRGGCGCRERRPPPRAGRRPPPLSALSRQRRLWWRAAHPAGSVPVRAGVAAGGSYLGLPFLYRPPSCCGAVAREMPGVTLGRGVLAPTSPRASPDPGAGALGGGGGSERALPLPRAPLSPPPGDEGGREPRALRSLLTRAGTSQTRLPPSRVCATWRRSAFSLRMLTGSRRAGGRAVASRRGGQRAQTRRRRGCSFRPQTGGCPGPRVVSAFLLDVHVKMPSLVKCDVTSS
ncbi:translation initiation factor IF-2-like [Acinonyx jubatus]|uniref:Translation initiation factor IF-2-like n=1 Tax=Acinonyx jubatus TaxID=32536 RepID=A0ABM3P223_ACIJB|nr:translation initiation factor IF-2-like [Acinonyx jubatus]XP_053065729.1 translation initiation factor IF-2-like [Acinonyx jubatus]XP_053065730.1 translation initiation factor IF-2-like [Acinonyx jubatus]